ncbi:MAG TPA: peptidoglycan DD-metalloendopeptidase family protein [Casimicrobiaceae bacterium]|jgi:lipoprotein NlpD
MITAIFRPYAVTPRFPSASRTATQLAAAAMIALLVAGCATRRPAPVEERPPPPRNGRALPAPPAAAQPATPPAPAAQAQAPAVKTYTVKRGDTLYQIALDNGVDYRELAVWNNVDNVDRIFVGQVLRLGPQGETVAAAPAPEGGVTTAPLHVVPPVTGTPATPGATTAGASAAPAAAPNATPATPPTIAQGNLKTSPKAIKQPYSDQAVRELTLAATAGPAPPAEVVRPTAPAEAHPPPPADDGDDDRLDWSWPAKGKVVAGFSESANLKGIDIAGVAGEAVVASAPGKVVYAGSGLRGYGKLIIIKHNKTYLSAYAHNREILVKEGQQVAKGQKIAEMGSTDADRVKLHFEIRRLGKPMDPARYLPPA